MTKVVDSGGPSCLSKTWAVSPVSPGTAIPAVLAVDNLTCSLLFQFFDLTGRQKAEVATAGSTKTRH
jgi:hypothetical protein